MSELREVIAAGYLLIRPIPRPDWASRELLPDTLISASTCICPQFPGTHAIEWCVDSPEQRVAAFDRIGLDPDERSAAMEWATAEFDRTFGWSGVFFTLEAALAVRSRFFPTSDLTVIAIGLPVKYRDQFIRVATPEPPEPGFAPAGKAGHLLAVEMHRPMPHGLTMLGYEPLNVEMGQVDHSWLCNGLDRFAADTLGIRPGPNGLLESRAAGVRCCEAIQRPEVGAEPGPWFPWLLARY